MTARPAKRSRAVTEQPYQSIADRLREAITNAEELATTDDDRHEAGGYLNGLRDALDIALAPPGVRWGSLTDDELDYVTDDEVNHVRGWAMGNNLRPVFERLVRERDLLAGRLAEAGRTPIIEYEVSDRGLAYPAPVTALDGRIVEVYDSSLATDEALWLRIKAPTTPGEVLDDASRALFSGIKGALAADGPMLEYAAQITLDDAVVLADQLIALALRRGKRITDDALAARLGAARIDAIVEFISRQGVEYRDHSSRALREDLRLALSMGVPLERLYDPEDVENVRTDLDAEAGREHLDALLDKLNAATEELNAAVPPAGDNDDKVITLSAYLGTIITAKALAGMLHRDTFALSLNDLTDEVVNHLANATDAAELGIHNIAIGTDTYEFPPSPRHLRNAHIGLQRLREHTERLTAGVGAVLDTIDCYADPDLLPADTDTESE
jgi:hypothetical protein